MGLCASLPSNPDAFIMQDGKLAGGFLASKGVLEYHQQNPKFLSTIASQTVDFSFRTPKDMFQTPTFRTVANDEPAMYLSDVFISLQPHVADGITPWHALVYLANYYAAPFAKYNVQALLNSGYVNATRDVKGRVASDMIALYLEDFKSARSMRMSALPSRYPNLVQELKRMEANDPGRVKFGADLKAFLGNARDDVISQYLDQLFRINYTSMESLKHITDAELTQVNIHGEHGALIRKLRAGEKALKPLPEGKKYVAFISHHKGGAAEVAYTFFNYFTELYGGNEVFLDSKELSDLRFLQDAVLASQVVVLLQTKELLYRPFCLVEIYTALRNRIPIVPVLLEGSGYDFAASQKFLDSPDFAAALDEHNPGASEELRRQGLDPSDIGRTIGTALPYLLSKSFNSMVAPKVREAMLAEIKDVVESKRS